MMLIGALALALVARPTAPVLSDIWQLHRSYVSAASIQVDSGGLDRDGLEVALARAVDRFREAGQSLDLTGESHGSGPRVLLR